MNSVNASNTSDDMPVAFEIGNQEKTIEINNNSSLVSLSNSKVKNDFKGHVFNLKSGRYVVLATVNDSNMKFKNILMIVSILKMTMSNIFSNILAKLKKLRFFNVG